MIFQGSDEMALQSPSSRFSGSGPSVLGYSLAAIAIILVSTLPGATDYIGADNDDVMRLVEVRDLLAGQGWYDLTQYRLGLAEGTPMHWSRLIDLPIAALIRLFALFLSPLGAEAIAATVWPLLLIPFLLWSLGLAGFRIGGTATMHIALGLGALFVVTCIRFMPGALDHHNVQLTLAMWIAAMLSDPEKRIASYVVAGVAAALALATGVETTPFVAVACACVALQWVWHGRGFAGPAQAFGLSLTLSVSAAFFATVPPSSYRVVTCDNFSLGFYGLSALGGSALFLLASLSRTSSRPRRIFLAAATGGLLLLAARLLAPQCLGDPLASLDPMLTELWLKNVSEARSFPATVAAEPETVGGFYAVGFFAMAVCLFRALRGKAVEFHLILLALIGMSWAVTLLQVRGAFFANLLSILPLSLLIADLRQRSKEDPGNAGVAFGYAGTVLISVPVLWALAGVAAVHSWRQAADAAVPGYAENTGAGAGVCGNARDRAALAALPAGVVAAPSDNGARILAETDHRVLSAPYHRNQKGMLTELHIGLATPTEAKAFLNGAGVTIVAFCPSDSQTRTLIRMKPDGLYAGLNRGAVPDYLQPIEREEGSGFQLYRVRQEGDREVKS